MISGKKTSYFNYGNYIKSSAEIFFPENIEEIKELCESAKKLNRKITIAGAFHSFDSQNSGSDMVLSLKKINFIRYNNTSHYIDVGPGAKWGEIAKEVYKNNSLLYICITGSEPSAGGTISANTNNVFTSCLGKEGKYCLEFDLLTTDGTLLNCSRNQNNDIFYAAIGGFGILGFIVRIRYEVFHVGSPYQINVSTVSHDTILDLEQKFNFREIDKPKKIEDFLSQSSLFYKDVNTYKLTTYERRYVKTQKKENHFTLRMYTSAILGFVIRFFPNVANYIMASDANKSDNKKLLIKGLHKVYYGLFWAHPDYIWMKYISKIFTPLGYKPKLYQNSYFIPDCNNNLSEFTKKTCETIEKYGLKFSMFDVMHIPKDEPFIMSPSRNEAGFYVNTTFFDTIDVPKLLACYEELNLLCYQMGGKINLVKSLFISNELLDKMYGNQVNELMEIKKQTDKNNLISSNFYTKRFPNSFKSTKR